MNKVIKLIFSISLITLLLLACNKNKCSHSVKAELKDLSVLDGCGFVIELKNGNKLEPLNLSDFDIDLNDGKKIWVSYHLTTKMIATACMVGDIVEIECLTNR